MTREQYKLRLKREHGTILFVEIGKLILNSVGKEESLMVQRVPYSKDTIRIVSIIIG